MTDITELAQREKFEAWFKSSFHPDITGPYIKDQLYFAWKAAGVELVEALEKAQQQITQLESRTVTVKLPDYGNTYKSPFADEVEHQVRLALELFSSAAGIKVEAE